MNETKPLKNVVLLINLGSPDSLTLSAIRKFLSKFLKDKRVVRLPKLLWLPILYGLILPFRAPKLFKQYKNIWLGSASPLVHYTKMQAQQLTALIESPDVIVKYAFSYATPDVEAVLHAVHQEYKVKCLNIIPLYPQFSSTTTAVVFDQVVNFYQNKYFLPQLRIINDFYTHDLYIQAIANSIRQSWHECGRSEQLVFSYHSLPEDIIKHGDDYFMQCMMTTKLVVHNLGITEADYVVAFQSKFGRQKWLSPSTVDTITDLAKRGIKSLDIVCPGFVSDCLETLEEIAESNKIVFLAGGGLKYTYIKCLNDSDEFIQVLYNLINFR